jgi:2-methylcitrate dehydratase PrpD
MKDPKVIAMRKRVEAVGDPQLNDPQRRWRCVMEVTLKDGRVLNHQTLAAKGTSEDPLTREEEEEKALDLIAPVLGKARTKALLAALWNVDGLKSVRPLRKLASA